jgi:4-amino-4-deoxy-L-arabinose transferase-like glycosyltransferase
MPSSSLARIAWAVLICATLYVCYFSHLGAIGFVGPDEPRYAWIARDMAESGDWVTPRLYGKPWFEKPPLYYWSAALSFKLFGVSEAAARLPSAVAALLATLTLAWLALRLYGAETARWLLLLLPTSVAMIGFSHAASTDMLFSATLTLALVAVTMLLRLTTPTSVVVAQHAAPDLNMASPSNVLTAVLFGFFLGLAVLAKGPAALILCGGAIFFWALFTGRWRDAFRLLYPAAIAAFCLTALPWYILCARRNPDFFRVFIIEHNFKRFLTPEFQHIQPFWYYAAVLLVALLPWTALLVWSGVTGAIRVWRTRTISAASCLLLCWAGFCLLFFSISKSKLPGYILPAIPPIAFLLSTRFASAIRNRVPVARWTAVTLAAFYVAAAAWCFRDLYSFRDHSRPHWAFIAGPVSVLFFAVPALMGGVASVTLAVLNRVRPAVFVAMATYLLMLSVIGGIPGRLDWHVSAKRVAGEIVTSSEHRVFVFHLQRSWLYQLNFYLRRDLPDWNGTTSEDAIVVAPQKALEDLKRAGAVWDVISDYSDRANVLKLRPSLNNLPGGGELR